MRIAVADLQVAQHLVVGAVFLDDEDDVADTRPDRRHVRLGGRAGGGPGEADIVGDLKRRRGQRLVVRQREFQHPRFFQLVDILVRRAAGIGLTTIDGELRRAALRVGARRALAVDDEHALAIGRRRHRAGIPAGRHQPRDGPAGGARCDDGDSIDPAQRHQQSPVAELGKAVGVEPLADRGGGERVRQGEARLRNQPRLDGIDHRKPVVIVLGGEQSVGADIGQQGGGLADRRDPAGDPDSRPRRRQRDDLPIAGRRHPGMAGIGPCDRKGILAARNAALRRVDLSGTQVLLGDDRTAIQVEQAHRVIVIVGDESVMPIRADRDARRLRLDPGTEAGGVAEPDRRGFDIPPA